MGSMHARIAVVLLLVFSLAGMASADSAGKSLFTSKCALCHGADASGQTAVGKSLKIPDLHSPEVQKLSDADLKAVISGGKNKMPPFKGKLTDTQIDQVVSYIRDLAKK
jgi:cytochrome c6